MKRTASRAGVPALLLALGACATPVPPQLPVLSYARADCAAQPDLAGAISLAPDKDKRIWTVNRPVAGDTPCLQRGGIAAPYLVLALPRAGSVRMVEIGSVMEGARVFSPAVVLLDGNGVETRSFAPDQYAVRTGLLSVQFSPSERDRYALVTVDPTRMGHSYDAITTGTGSTYVPLGTTGGMNWRSGHEWQSSRGFSYEGVMRANVYRLEE